MPLIEVDMGSVAVGPSKLGINTDCLVEVLNGPLTLAKVLVEETSFEVGFGTLGIEADGLIIILDGFSTLCLSQFKRRTTASTGCSIYRVLGSTTWALLFKKRIASPIY